MKQITTALLAIVILLAGAVEAQAQKKAKLKKEKLR